MATPLRILQLVPAITKTSGVFQVVLNWHRHIDVANIQFDYLYFWDNPCTSQANEIEKLGGHSFYLSYKNPFRFLADLRRIFKENKYVAIHSHVLQLPIVIFPLAKIYGIRSIIQHAHSTCWSNKKVKAMRNYLMLHAIWPLITCRLACSKQAGECFFKKDFTVVNNGIEAEKFDYRPAVRVLKRRELGVETDFVIGHVGRLEPGKNHNFLIHVFKEIVKARSTSKLMLVGNGPLDMELKQLVKQEALEDKVCFLGARNDVPDLMQAFDVFVMPSLFEGFPVVALEAQAAGLPSIFSANITRDVLLTPQSFQIPLGAGPQAWAAKILALQNVPRASGAGYVTERGFDVHQIAAEMQQFYIQQADMRENNS